MTKHLQNSHASRSSQQTESTANKDTPKAVGTLIVAFLIELMAFYFGYSGMNFLFEDCSYSRVPFLIVLLLAIFGVILATVATVKLSKTRHRAAMVLGIIVTILSAAIGCYGSIAAGLIFCF